MKGDDHEARRSLSAVTPRPASGHFTRHHIGELRPTPPAPTHIPPLGANLPGARLVDRTRRSSS